MKRTVTGEYAAMVLNDGIYEVIISGRVMFAHEDYEIANTWFCEL